MARGCRRALRSAQTHDRPLWTAPGATTAVDNEAGRAQTPPTPAPLASPTMTGVATRATAAFFDLDKTIIAKSSSLAFSKPFQAGGLITRGALLRSAYAQFVFFVGGADHDQMEKMRQFMSQLVAGWDVATVREIVADTLHNIVDPLVFDEAVSLIEEHKLAGRDVVVVSASGAEVVGPIAEMLGADRVVATRLEIVDGRYTGEIDYYAYAEEKARAIEVLAQAVRLRPGRRATPTATPSPTCTCWRWSATRMPSTPTRSCAGSPSPGAGRSWSSPSRWPCARGSP